MSAETEQMANEVFEAVKGYVDKRVDTLRQPILEAIGSILREERDKMRESLDAHMHALETSVQKRMATFEEQAGIAARVKSLEDDQRRAPVTPGTLRAVNDR